MDKSGYYSGSISQGVVNPAYGTLHKRKLSLDKVSESSLFDVNMDDDDDFLWDKNQDSGLVSAVSLYHLRVLNACGQFSAIFYKGDNFCNFLFLPCTSSPLRKRSTLKEKNLLPLGYLNHVA